MKSNKKCSKRALFQIAPMELTKQEALAIAKPLRKVRHCVTLRSYVGKPSGRRYYGVFAGSAR